MPTSLTNSKITFNTKSISETNGKLDILPIGFVYWQLPGKKAPGDMFAGTWTNISDEFAGLFFRAEGGNANAFEGGSQEDKIRNIRGEFPTQGNYFTNRATSRGAFITTKKGVVDGGDSNDGNYANEIRIDANTDTNDFGNPMAGHADGPEIRPVNTTIRIWERTA